MELVFSFTVLIPCDDVCVKQIVEDTPNHYKQLK
jgi:hypothetical protein